MEKHKDILDLIKNAKEGDKGSFEQLVRKYNIAMLNFIKCKLQNEDDVLDINQQLWERVFKNIDKYDSKKASFYTWTRTIANNIIKNFYIKNRREKDYRYFSPEEIDIENFVDLSEKSKDPEKKILLINLYNKVLKIAMLEAGVPHQSLVTCLTKMMSGWNPKNVVNELSEKNIEEITEIFKKDIYSYIDKNVEKLDDIFCNFNVKIRMKLKYLLKQGTGSNYLIEILEKEVKNTKLKDYFGKNPEHNISDWSNKVKIRILKIFRKNYLK